MSGETKGARVKLFIVFAMSILLQTSAVFALDCQSQKEIAQQSDADLYNTAQEQIGSCEFSETHESISPKEYWIWPEVNAEGWRSENPVGTSTDRAETLKVLRDLLDTCSCSLN